MIENWLKSNRNYICAWLLTILLGIFAAYINIEVRQRGAVSPVEDSVLRK
jgi:hypothetical protein